MSERQVALGTAFEVYPEWRNLVGKNVQVRMEEAAVDSGTVDAVTNDGLVLWLEAHGAIGRRLLLKTDGYEIWGEPEESVGTNGTDETTSMGETFGKGIRA